MNMDPPPGCIAAFILILCAIALFQMAMEGIKFLALIKWVSL